MCISTLVLVVMHHVLLHTMCLICQVQHLTFPPPQWPRLAMVLFPPFLFLHQEHFWFISTSILVSNTNYELDSEIYKHMRALFYNLTICCGLVSTTYSTYTLLSPPWLKFYVIILPWLGRPPTSCILVSLSMHLLLPSIGVCTPFYHKLWCDVDHMIFTMFNKTTHYLSIIEIFVGVSLSYQYQSLIKPLFFVHTFPLQSR